MMRRFLVLLACAFVLDGCPNKSEADSGICDSRCRPPKCTWVEAKQLCAQRCASDAECPEREVCLCDGPECFFSDVTSEGPFPAETNTCIYFGGPSRSARADAGMRPHFMRDAGLDNSR